MSTTRIDTVRIGILGCGNIAKTYAKDVARYPRISLAGFYDVDAERAAAYAAEHGGSAYPSLEAMLADPGIDLVVNLTTHIHHYPLSKRCLEAGKHVFSEKPLALSRTDAEDLQATAEARGLRLGAAPINHLGEAQQTFLKALQERDVGPVRLAYAEINHGCIEDWHPNPAPFYDVGVLWDVGVYPLTLLCNALGPIDEVRAWGTFVKRERETKDGRPFTLTTPDWGLATLRFAGGAHARLSANFYAAPAHNSHGIELHGDRGSVYVEHFQGFDSAVRYAPSRGAWQDLPLVRPGCPGSEYGRGIEDMVDAILENRPHRARADVAVHVVSVLEAIHTSIAADGAPQTVDGSFEIADMMPWSR